MAGAAPFGSMQPLELLFLFFGIPGDASSPHRNSKRAVTTPLVLWSSQVAMQHKAAVKKFVHCTALVLVLLVASQLPGLAQGSSEAEANFIAMLKNATLKGTWAPVQQAQLGASRKDEGYRIARVEKKEGDKWTLVYLVSYQGKDIEYPMPVTVKFAGDTAVLILDNVRAGRDKANWSARVMFHENVYTGRWWETGNKEHGGTIEGIVTQAK